jgi:Holliday junction DNA helicase RuvA
VIRSVRGRVAALGGDVAVVEVGGIGVALVCTPTTMARLRVGEGTTLAAALVVREDSLTLYGFLDDDERACFEIVQTATGVGPRLAQAMLAVHSPEQLRRAVATEDLAALVQVPGIGRKGAQRIVLDLKDRLGPATGNGAAPTSRPGVAPWRDQLAEALLGLGWSSRQVEDAIAAVTPDAAAGGAEPDIGALLRAALRTLGRQ